MLHLHARCKRAVQAHALFDGTRKLSGLVIPLHFKYKHAKAKIHPHKGFYCVSARVPTCVSFEWSRGQPARQSPLHGQQCEPTTSLCHCKRTPNASGKMATLQCVYVCVHGQAPRCLFQTSPCKWCPNSRSIPKYLISCRILKIRETHLHPWNGQTFEFFHCL